MGAIDCWSAAPLLGAEPIFLGEEADRIMERTMPFLKDFLRNLAILAVIGLALFVLWPNLMGSVVQLYGTAPGAYGDRCSGGYRPPAQEDSSGLREECLQRAWSEPWLGRSGRGEQG